MYYIQTTVGSKADSRLLYRSVGNNTDDGKIRVELCRSSLKENPAYVIDMRELVSVTLKLRLDSCGNPDCRQDPDRSLIGVVGGLVVVDTLEQAKSKCRAFVEDNELGSGNWAGGQVFANDRLVAYVSYNGRLWTEETASFRNVLRQIEATEPSI